MPKTITLRLDDSDYEIFRRIAEQENRPISNFIETAAKRFAHEYQFVDDFEMEEIRSNIGLNKSLKRGLRDARQRRGEFV